MTQETTEERLEAEEPEQPAAIPPELDPNAPGLSNSQRWYRRKKLGLVTPRSSISSSARSTRTAGERSAGPKDAVLAGIHDDITSAFTWLGLGAVTFLPVTGTVMLTRAERNADHVVNLARKDPRVYRALVVAMRYAAYVSMLEIFAILAVAVAVDMGNLPKQSMIAQRLLGNEIQAVEESQRGDSAATAAGNGTGQQPAAPSWSAGPPRSVV